MRWRDFTESVEGIVILGLVISLAASALYDFLNLRDHSIRLRRCLVSSAIYACCKIKNLFLPEAAKSHCDLEGGDYQKLKTDSAKGDDSGKVSWLLRTTLSFFRKASDEISQQRGINKNPAPDPSELDHEPSENDLEVVDGDDASPTGELTAYQRNRRRMTERRKKKKKSKYQTRERDSWKGASESSFEFERGV